MCITITIPAPLVPHARSGAHIALSLAAQGIVESAERPDRETHPERYAGPLRRFDGARELLNSMGWRSIASAVHVDESRAAALLEALREQAAIVEDPDLTAYLASLASEVGHGTGGDA